MARRWEKRFLTELEETANVSGSAKTAGITRQTAYDYRRDNVEFAAKWDRAIEIGIATLEDEAIRRARDGVDEPIYQRGEYMGTVKKYSDTLLIFMLKTRKPKVYNPPQEIKGTGEGGAIPIVITKMGIDEL